MCTNCGCDGNGGPGTVEHAEAHAHSRWGGDGLSYRPVHPHGHDHPRTHADVEEAGPARRVSVERDILAKNNALAGINRQALEQQGILALNLVSSPGAGKTRLLERSITALRGKYPLGVIEGDQQTRLDADRIRASGAAVVQINTGKGCHLDAQRVHRALGELALPQGGVLFIENVGNLVCPAAFDLGERCKVVILSVTEGEDKPLKYPDMFRAARLMLLNKIDLLPYLDFELGRVLDNARRVNPAIEIVSLSAATGEGMAHWLAWLEGEHAALQAHAVGHGDAFRGRRAALDVQSVAG